MAAKGGKGGGKQWVNGGRGKAKGKDFDFLCNFLSFSLNIFIHPPVYPLFFFFLPIFKSFKKKNEASEDFLRGNKKKEKKEEKKGKKKGKTLKRRVESRSSSLGLIGHVENWFSFDVFRMGGEGRKGKKKSWKEKKNKLNIVNVIY